MAKSNLIIALVTLMILSIGVPFVSATITKNSCTPAACPQNTNGPGGHISNTPWDSNWLNASYSFFSPDVCAVSGGKSGDYCLRTCYYDTGCYGTPTLWDSQYAPYTASCTLAGYVQADSFVDYFDRCYMVDSVSTTDSDSSTYLYSGVHYGILNTSSLQQVDFLNSWDSGGTSSFLDQKYIYIPQFGTGYPTGYDDIVPDQGIVPIFRTKTTIGNRGGCQAGQTWTITAEQDVFSVPVVTNFSLANATSCIQNARLDVNPQLQNQKLFIYANNTVEKNEGNKATATNVVRPSNNILHLEYGLDDDPQDCGFWNSVGLGCVKNVSMRVYFDGVLKFSGLGDGVAYAAVCNATECVGNITGLNYAFMDLDISSYINGVHTIRTVIDDGFYTDRGIAPFTRDYSISISSPQVPSVYMLAPDNNTVFQNGTVINFTFGSSSPNSAYVTDNLYFNNVLNSSVYELTGTYTRSVQFNAVGLYSWKVQSTDTVGTGTSETRYFTVTNPSYPTISSVNVPTPQNVGANLVANATVIPGSYPISTVTYTMSPSGMSTSMVNVGGNNWAASFGAIPVSWATNQNYNITACDTSSFCTSSVGAVQINHNPSFVSQIVNPISPSTYNPTLTTMFNSSWTEDISLSVCAFSLDGTAYSATRIGNTCSYSVTGLSAGTHNYGWNVADIGGLTNQTVGYPNSYTYVVNKATPTIVHSVSPSNSVPSGTAVSGSCNVANNTGSTMTYNRCTLQVSASQASPGTLTFGPVTPGVGTYSCNCSVASSANWNYAQNIITLTVSGSTPPSVTNLRPLNATVINSGVPTVYNATVTAGSYGLDSAYAYIYDSGTYRINAQPMSLGANWYTSITLNEAWGNYLYYGVSAKDVNNNFGYSANFPNTNAIINNHPPTYSSINVSPAMPVQFSPSRVYTFSATWVDDLFAVTNTNITIDGTTYAGVNAGGNLWQYNITGLAYGQHNYTWSAKDTYNAIRTTPVQYYSVGQIAPIFTINILPSVSVVSGIQTNASCTADLNVTLQLWRNGVLVSNPDVQTLSAGQYNYLCNFTPTGNYSYSYTTDLLIVNSPNAQTQSQFCDGQLDKTYTYNNGGENYTMCVNIPCGSNVTSATVNLTGLVLYRINQLYSNLFSQGLGAYTNNCTSLGGNSLTNFYCNNSIRGNVTATQIYLDGSYVVNLYANNVKIINSTVNTSIANYRWNVSNVIIQNANILNGRVISGSITYNENGQVQFDT